MTTWMQRVSWDRPITSYSKVQGLISRFIRNRRFHINYDSLSRKKYLNVGCGPYPKPTCINLDYGWHPEIDICWDITKGLPLDDHSVTGIFTEHVLEHISFSSCDYVLGEFRRILKPGGVLRIVVPDGELYLSRYTELMQLLTNEPLPYSSGDSYEGLYSPMMSVNRIFRAHGHQFIYDFQTFDLLLHKNGFTEVQKAEYNHGRNPDLLFDQKSRSVESLYVEAIAPIN